MTNTFPELKSGYAALWSTMAIRPEKAASVSAIAQKLIANKSRYQRIEKLTGVPWFVIAALHQRESGADFDTYLGNGEPLNRKTRIVPAGRGPWSSFEDGAVDALKLDGLDKVREWGPEIAAYSIEKFNGFGYRNKRIPSPYLWSFSNHYSAGKYVSDGVFDKNAIDKQCGALPVLKKIMELDRTATFKSAPTATAPAPSVAKPVGIVGGIGAVLAGAAHALGAHWMITTTVAVAAAVVALVIYVRRTE